MGVKAGRLPNDSFVAECERLTRRPPTQGLSSP